MAKLIELAFCGWLGLNLARTFVEMTHPRLARMTSPAARNGCAAMSGRQTSPASVRRVPALSRRTRGLTLDGTTGAVAIAALLLPCCWLFRGFVARKCRLHRAALNFENPLTDRTETTERVFQRGSFSPAGRSKSHRALLELPRVIFMVWRRGHRAMALSAVLLFFSPAVF